MEVFLLLLDEIDDAVAVLRSLWPRIVGLLLAVALLLATGFAFLSFPQLALSATALLLSATLLERIRRRRHVPQAQTKGEWIAESESA